MVAVVVGIIDHRHKRWQREESIQSTEYLLDTCCNWTSEMESTTSLPPLLPPLPSPLPAPKHSARFGSVWKHFQNKLSLRRARRQRQVNATQCTYVVLPTPYFASFSISVEFYWFNACRNRGDDDSS